MLQKLKFPVKSALVQSVMAAEPEAATELLQLLHSALEEATRPVTSQVLRQPQQTD